jgi:hypothetical protein
VLIEQLVNLKFNLDKMIVFVGGCEENIDVKINGIRHVFSRNNTFDLSCIVAMLDLNIVVRYFFLLHDTVSIENEKFKAFIDFYPLNKNSTVSITAFPSMNMGFYSLDVVKKYSKEIYKISNYGSDNNTLQEVKKECIIKEDLIFKLNKKHKFAFGHGIKPVCQEVTYMDKLRLRESYAEIGLLKYKANYFIKNKYIIDL